MKPNNRNISKFVLKKLELNQISPCKNVHTFLIFRTETSVGMQRQCTHHSYYPEERLVIFTSLTIIRTQCKMKHTLKWTIPFLSKNTLYSFNASYQSKPWSRCSHLDSFSFKCNETETEGANSLVPSVRWILDSSSNLPTKLVTEW